MELPPALDGAPPMTSLLRPGATADPSSIESPEAVELDAIAANGRPISLPDAVGMAFRLQPRLRAQLESIAQAKGRQEILTSAFLPIAGGSYSAGGFSLGVGGQPIRLPGGPTGGFNFAPGLGAVPVGLNLSTGYELAEFRVQWLVCDFGRRLGRLEQAKLALDVAKLQTDRAFQTVSNEVSVAFYGVLREPSPSWRTHGPGTQAVRADEEL